MSNHSLAAAEPLFLPFAGERGEETEIRQFDNAKGLQHMPEQTYSFHLKLAGRSPATSFTQIKNKQPWSYI